VTVLVQKYGGSSVADVDKIGLVADRVAFAKRSGFDVVVVVSAMGKTTDELLALAKRVAGTTEPPRRELDMLLTTGERVSMALLCIALAARGVDAVSFTGSQCGIITNDRHFDARIIEVRPFRIEDELSRGRVVVVAGYQGMSYKREITTLGRGGSDTTAVALAAALGAPRCEIYSDVDGVYSADPRVVQDAVHLPEISLDVLSEMAEAGAKVLNAQAVEWARKHKVAIHARKTTDPNEGGRETISRTGSERKARAIVGLPKVVRLSGATLLPQVQELPTLDAITANGQQSCLVPLLNVPDWEAVQKTLAGVTIERDLALVSVVGDGLLGPDSYAAKFLRVLSEVGASCRQSTGSEGAARRVPTLVRRRRRGTSRLRALGPRRALLLPRSEAHGDAAAASVSAWRRLGIQCWRR
jgi:aspartate kinase